MTTYAALLRGINVGGNNPVSMAELRACLEAAGFEGVRTYINSGNVIFRASSGDAAAVEAQVERAIEAQFGQAIPAVVLDLPAMEALVDQIPAEWRSDKDLRVYLWFMRRRVDGERAMASIETRDGVEELRLLPGALLWAAKRSELGKSKVAKLVNTPLYKELTSRNVNTTLKVLELMRAAEAADGC